jgi:hypothetical protein
MPLEDIIPYKKYQIVLIKADHMKSFGDYVNGYVYLPGLEKSNIPDGNLGSETFRNGNIVGIDTAHYHNEKMTYEQRKADAIRQIKEIINEYESLLEEK